MAIYKYEWVQNDNSSLLRANCKGNYYFSAKRLIPALCLDIYEVTKAVDKRYFISA